jgi:hypothetical protein
VRALEQTLDVGEFAGEQKVAPQQKIKNRQFFLPFYCQINMTRTTKYRMIEFFQICHIQTVVIKRSIK